VPKLQTSGGFKVAECSDGVVSIQKELLGGANKHGAYLEELGLGRRGGGRQAHVLLLIRAEKRLILLERGVERRKTARSRQSVLCVAHNEQS
jgi:hypothetical protein